MLNHRYTKKGELRVYDGRRRATHEQKRDYFNSLIKDSRFSFLPSAGTYFQLVKYDKIAKEKDKDFAVRITKEHKVASIPVSVFYAGQEQPQLLRICFAKSEQSLNQGAQILKSIHGL